MRTFCGDRVFFSVEAFSFVNFIKMRLNMANSVSREVWLWRSRSKNSTKFCKLTFFCGYITKLFTNFVKYKRNNKIWKSIKFGKSLFNDSVFWFVMNILEKIYWPEETFYFSFLIFKESRTIINRKNSREMFFPGLPSRIYVKNRK